MIVIRSKRSNLKKFDCFGYGNVNSKNCITGSRKRNQSYRDKRQSAQGGCLVIQMQWIAMEYTMIRHSLFLKWMQDGCRNLAYETLRDYLVLITRMTGYEEDDIYEYLENSFDELVWEWGYLSLIVGK